jgi:hypothetical protein
MTDCEDCGKELDLEYYWHDGQMVLFSCVCGFEIEKRVRDAPRKG